MALSQGLYQRQLQKLSPQQIQLMKLLQVPTALLEFQAAPLMHIVPKRKTSWKRCRELYDLFVCEEKKNQ